MIEEQEEIDHIKIMDEEQEVVRLLRNEIQTYFALNVMKYFILEDRCILVKRVDIGDGKYRNVRFGVYDLQKAIGAKSRQTAWRHIRRLKKLNVIRSLHTPDYGQVMAINPRYYVHGTSIPQNIIDLFDGKIKEEEFVEKKKNIIGYLYVVKLDKHYKIGVSKRPNTRLKEFTLLPYELEDILIMKVNGYYTREKELHEHFADKRVRGEWFELNEEDIEYIKEYLKEYEVE